MSKKNILHIITLILVLGLFFLNVHFACIAQEKSKLGYSVNRLTFSGGTIGGTSNLMANGLSAIGYKYLGIQGTVISNPTMTQVLVLQEKEADISTMVGYQGYFAYHNTSQWNREGFPELRTLLQGNRTTWHFAVMANSPIKDIKDLVGKKVVVGKKGFFSEDATKYLFEALNLDYSAIKPVYLGHPDAMAALLTGKVDAYAVVSDPPQPTFTQLTQGHNVRIIGLTEKELELAIQKWPGSEPTIITGGTYKGNDKDILAPASWMLYGCRNELPEDVAYGLTKEFWENKEFAGLQWAKLATYKLEDVPKFKTAPYHIGAYKYYKEKGLDIPEIMIPPEAEN